MAFPGEIRRTPRNWVEKSYPNVIYFNDVNKGGHFVAFEEARALQRGGTRLLQATS